MHGLQSHGLHGLQSQDLLQDLLQDLSQDLSQDVRSQELHGLLPHGLLPQDLESHGLLPECLWLHSICTVHVEFLIHGGGGHLFHGGNGIKYSLS